ncbi:MAG: baseplate J/gp47 family protein [Bacteroidota bacterium]
MTNNLQSGKRLFRDGTSQQDRYQEALQPDYVQVEGRSMEQLIREAQDLSKELRFFNEKNEAQGTWESFLIDDPEAYRANSAHGKKIQQQQWARQLATYVENPDHFSEDEKLLNRLSKPHTALFLAFLKLLNQIKAQLNQLTERHLDFYFRERLRLEPKEAVPDVVNVLIGLTEEVAQLEIKQGTVLHAGTDAEGNDLHYTTDKDTIISQAEVAQLKSIFLDKQSVTIKSAHLDNVGEPDRGLTAMMEHVLGRPRQGDPLPPLPSVFNNLDELYEEVLNETHKAMIHYLNEELFLSVADFKQVMEIQQEIMNGTSSLDKVVTIHAILVVAFRKKNRRRLKRIWESEGLDYLLKHVYGTPDSGDELPPYGGNPTNFEKVLTDLNGQDETVQQSALTYIEDELKLTVQDFAHIQRTGANQSATAEDWDHVYTILEEAALVIEKGNYPSSIQEWIKLRISLHHLSFQEEEDHGFNVLMRYVFGEPEQGDPLPPFPNQVNDLDELYEQVLLNKQAISTDYLNHELFLSVENFKRIMETHRKEKEGVPVEWEPVYKIMDEAFENKAKQKRREELKRLQESEGFDYLVSHVYGTPDPGDNLPLYRDSPAVFQVLVDELQSHDAVKNQQASDYIEEALKLTVADFIFIHQVSGDEAARTVDWERVYVLLELADRQIRSVVFPSSVMEKLGGIYAATDVKAHAFSQYGDKEESKRFKTFGNWRPGVEQSVAEQSLQAASLGFAISTPALLLREGTRKITVLLDLQVADEDVSSLQSLFDEGVMEVCLSSKETWLTPDAPSFKLGHYLGVAHEGTYTASVAGRTLTKTKGEDFVDADAGKYLVMPDGKLLEILSKRTEHQVEVREVVDQLDVGDGVPFETTRKYAREDVYLHALKVEMTLQEDALPIETWEGEGNYLLSAHPSVVFSLNQDLAAREKSKGASFSYDHLMQLTLNKAQVVVNVQGMQNVTLQNDRSVLDARKPFELFGYEPEIGSSFYLINEEIALKKIQDLVLEPQWMNLPDLKAHYKNYWLIEEDDPDLNEEAYVIKQNEDIKLRAYVHHKHAAIPLTTDESTVSLFPNQVKNGEEIPEGQKAAINIRNLPWLMKQSMPTYRYEQSPDAKAGAGEVIDWDRYVRFELAAVDFQHAVYNTLFSKQAQSDKEEIRKLTINPPYQPKLQGLKIGYTAYASIPSTNSKGTGYDAFYHLHPFGFKEVALKEQTTLVPHYEHEGALLLGIDRLEVPQLLTILFQMAEGSANPDAEKPELQWSYLRDNEWVVLPRSALVSDTTNGLLNTGIVKVRVPADATTGGTLLSDALHWLKVSASGHIEGISDTIEVKAQAIPATLSSKEVAAAHFETPLAAGTIMDMLEPVPEVAAVSQPFSSSKGKPAEQGASLYTQLSERLRHKNRALTMWDYERMVLDRFPQVYKAKCLPSEETLGQVDVIVVPDIKGSLPFNPFAPKVAADTLMQIREYLNAHAPAYAEVVVHNPFYLQVLTRCAVSFYPEYDAAYYKAKLIDEIKRFLSPWAYDEGNDIRIGGRLHASVLINFIAERPYIDYVANLKLFQSEDGKKFIDVRSVNDGKTILIPSRPDMVMVSAPDHIIDVVDENEYDEDHFEGLGYMIVETDFIVAENLQSVTASKTKN